MCAPFSAQKIKKFPVINHRGDTEMILEWKQNGDENEEIKIPECEGKPDILAVGTALELIVMMRDTDSPEDICRWIGIDIDDYYMGVGVIYTMLKAYIKSL